MAPANRPEHDYASPCGCLWLAGRFVWSCSAAHTACASRGEHPHAPPRCTYRGCKETPKAPATKCDQHLVWQRNYQRKRYDAAPEEHKKRCREAYHLKNDGLPKKQLKHCRRCGEPGHFAKTCPQPAPVQP